MTPKLSTRTRITRVSAGEFFLFGFDQARERMALLCEEQLPHWQGPNPQEETIITSFLCRQQIKTPLLPLLLASSMYHHEILPLVREAIYTSKRWIFCPLWPILHKIGMWRNPKPLLEMPLFPACGVRTPWGFTAASAIAGLKWQ